MITRASYAGNVRRAERTLVKRVSGYIKDPNEKNVHDIRTATRRVLAGVQLLSKKLRNEREVADFKARLEKLMKLNAKTRDLDIVTGKVAKRNESGEHDELLERLNKMRQSRIKPGLKFARSLQSDLTVPVRLKVLSGADLKKRFAKVCGKYESRIEKRVPTVVSEPEEKKELHLLREDVRRLRYTLDLGETKSLREQLKLLKSWQDILGAIHDSDIFIQYFDKSKKSSEIGSLLDDETTIRDSNYEKFKSLAESPLKIEV